MNDSLDSLVSMIRIYGWVFSIEPADVAEQVTATGCHLVALAYEATIRSPMGESRWEAETPAEALAMAFAAVAQMNGMPA